MIDYPPEKGSLVFLRDGWYFRAQDVQDEPTTHAAIHHRLHIGKTDKALLLENQGTTADRVCWSAYVNGEVIIVWEDDIVRVKNDL